MNSLRNKLRYVLNEEVPLREEPTYDAKLRALPREHRDQLAGLIDSAYEQYTSEEGRPFLPILTSDLDMSVRASNCLTDLRKDGIETVGELVQMSPGELLKYQRLGRKSLDEIEEILSIMGLKLMENDK